MKTYPASKVVYFGNQPAVKDEPYSSYIMIDPSQIEKPKVSLFSHVPVSVGVEEYSPKLGPIRITYAESARSANDGGDDIQIHFQDELIYEGTSYLQATELEQLFKKIMGYTGVYTVEVEELPT